MKGEGNSINYKYRMHDPRIGRFFAVDPLSESFSNLSPYGFANNSPIQLIEVDGLYGGKPNSTSTPKPKKVHYYNVIVKSDGSKIINYSRSSHQAILRYGMNRSIYGKFVKVDEYWEPTATTDIYTYWDTEGNVLHQDIKKGGYQAPTYDPRTITSGNSVYAASQTTFKQASNIIGPNGTGENGGAEIVTGFTVRDSPFNIRVIQTVDQQSTPIQYRSFQTLPNVRSGMFNSATGLYRSTFVDQGRFSPAGEMGSGLFYTQPNIPNEYTTGRTFFYDMPNAQNGHYSLTFETTAVMKNTRIKTEPIYLLGSFRWGWQNRGLSTTGAASGGIPNLLYRTTQNSYNIIKKDYPNENIIR